MVRRVFDFWLKMRKCPNGVPYYLQHQVWKPGEDDPRGLGGDQIPMALSSWNLLYGYLGEPAVKENMVLMADYWLAHGMSRPDLLWANLPYPYNTDLHSGHYDGDMRAGKGFLQPDKAASFGAELVVLYKMTGIAQVPRCGRQDREHAGGQNSSRATATTRPGRTASTPRPAKSTRQTKDGKAYAASYTSNYTGALRLFADLIALDQGQDRSLRAGARQIVTAWLKAYPLKTNKWGPFFEDIPTGDWSDTEINADTLAAYILEHPDWDPDWREQAKRILDWSYTNVCEQGVCPVGGCRHQRADRLRGSGQQPHIAARFGRTALLRKDRRSAP